MNSPKLDLSKPLRGIDSKKPVTILSDKGPELECPLVGYYHGCTDMICFAYCTLENYEPVKLKRKIRVAQAIVKLTCGTRFWIPDILFESREQAEKDGYDVVKFPHGEWIEVEA